MRPRIAGVVLAGGEGHRLGGAKALLHLAGKALIRHAIDRLEPQVDALCISVRGTGRSFEDLGYELAHDETDLPLGPVAGIAAGLTAVASAGFNLAAIVPCDAPFLPPDLVTHLYENLGSARAVIASDSRRHPTIGLWSTSLAVPLLRALADGRRRLDDLCLELGVATVAAAARWPAWTLSNVNTPDELKAAEDIARNLAGASN